MTYHCKLDVFEGPLDLLLHLIKERKMDICDIPIADITQQYISYLDVMKELNLEIVGEYLLMAAELTRIKSQMLLPVQEQEGEEEEPGEDPRAELMRRLLEYQRYKDASFELRRREYDRQQVFIRGAELEIEKSEGQETLIDATVFDLLKAFQGILKTKDFKKDFVIEVTELSVSDQIQYILEIINSTESVTFDSLFTPLNAKQEIIVTFLALLELMRLKLLRVQQTGQYETIRIYKTADKETQIEVLKQMEAHFELPLDSANSLDQGA